MFYVYLPIYINFIPPIYVCIITAKEKSTEAPTPPPKPQPSPKKEQVKAVAIPPPPAPTIIYQNAPPVYIQGGGGHTMSAIDVRRQMEDSLKQNDEHWQQRMAQLEETLKKTNAILEQEYSAAVEDVRKRFATAAQAHQLPPCQDLKAQLIACYRAHPGETLKCHEEAAMFRDCVNMHRIKQLDAEPVKQAEQKSSKPIAKAG